MPAPVEVISGLSTRPVRVGQTGVCLFSLSGIYIIPKKLCGIKKKKTCSGKSSCFIFVLC